MRNLAATTLATVTLAMGAPGISLALPLAAGLDRTIAAAPVGAQVLAVNGQPRRYRVVTARRSADYLYSFYPGAAVSYGAVVGGGYPYYYVPNGYPYYYSHSWPQYYGRYRYPGLDYSPYAFFGYRPSDFW